MKRQSKRGIVFLTTLMISAVVVMLLTAAMILLPSGATGAGSVKDDALAQAAAQAGLEYVRTRLQQNPGWRGDANAVTVDLPKSMWVREDHGNVVGILTTPSGATSMFRLRFNFQNGADLPKENLDDPSPEMAIQLPYVSYNNVRGGGPLPLFRADGSGFSVRQNSEVVGEVPRFGAVLYCQGLAGPAVGEASPSNLTPESSGEKVSVRILEAFLARDASSYGDSVLYAGDNIKVDLSDPLEIKSRDRDVPPRIRTMGSVDAVASELKMKKGEVLVNDDNGHFNFNSSPSQDPVGKPEDSSNSFIQLGWSDVPQAAPTDAQMNAGTYVWRDNPRRLEYYDQEYVAEKPAVPATPSSPATPATPAVIPTGTPTAVYTSASGLATTGGAVSLNPDLLSLRFHENVSIKANGTATGLAVIADTGVRSVLGGRPVNSLAPGSADDPAPVVSSAGDVQFEGRLYGSGAIASQKSISIQGSSVLEADPDEMVALFAKDDITIKAVPANVTVTSSSGNSGNGGGNGWWGSGSGHNGYNWGSDWGSDWGYGSGSGGRGANPIRPINGSPPIVSLPGNNGNNNGYFHGNPPSLGPVKPTDIAFTGVVYAQRNFNVLLDNGVNRGDFYLRGVLVAYGGEYEPNGTRDLPGTEEGFINIVAEGAKLEYDSTYVANLKGMGALTPLETISWRSL